MADDDMDDCLLMRDALSETGIQYDLRVVGDGEELFDYLDRSGKFAEPEAAPRPDLILLDLHITKPVTFRTLVDSVRLLSQYWFELVERPPT